MTVDQDPAAAALAEAIAVAHGVCALARSLGIKHPAICKWKRVPASRVLAVEALTGVPRADLRPDLYPAEKERAA